MTWKNELRKAPFDVKQRQREAEEMNMAKLNELLEEEVDPKLRTKIDNGDRSPYQILLDRNLIRNMVRLAGGDESEFLDAMSDIYNTEVSLEEPYRTGGQNMLWLVFDDDPMVK